MNLAHLVSLADGWSTLSQASDALSHTGRVVQMEGVPAPAKPLFLAHLRKSLKRPLVIVTYREETAAQITSPLELLLPPGSVIKRLPSSLNLLLDDQESGRDVRQAGLRLATLIDLAHGVAPDVIVTTAAALLQKVPPPATLKPRRLTLKVGETLRLDTLAVRLTAFGYTREDMASLPGAFSRRGDILDIFPSDADLPVRIDLFGDEIESIRTFDRESQRSLGKIDSVTIVPAHELSYTRETMASTAEFLKKRIAREISTRQKASDEPERIERMRDSAEADMVRISQAAYFAGIERYLTLLHPDAVTIADYLPENAVIVLDEPAQLSAYAEKETEIVLRNLASRAERGEIVYPASADPSPVDDFSQTFLQLVERRSTLAFSLLARGLDWLKVTDRLEVEGAGLESFSGRPGALIDALETYIKNGAKVAVVSAQAPRVRGAMTEKNIPETSIEHLISKKAPGVSLVNGVLPGGGFRLPGPKLVVITDAELFGLPDAKKRVKRKEFRDGLRITSLMDIKPGAFVVHIHHGIGRYQGLTRMSVQGVEREYLLVEYEGSDRLYVPVDQVDRIQKYIGSEGGAPSMHKLGGTEWLKTTARAQRQVREIAGELVQLYAARLSTEGHPYAPDTPWVKEMEDAFPYVETPDQYAAIEDVKRDLEAPRPMDRLICGDVGYGKTEVAMRAAFKVASEGRQVAILCPTTVLAAQHYQNFVERLAAFPVRIDQMSRFRSPKQLAQTIEGIKHGTVDIVVGTHRLLSKDVSFKDLGLVVVDEEQRFGVVHKERLKQLRKTVDVLTMTATPIPRTLHMSMSGIRDMSLINDPPDGRIPVKTYIKEHDDLLVREAIQRELDRGGQAYYLHNRVESIYHVVHRLERLLPHARFRVAHGQMAEDDLEEAMLDFYQRRFDVLVCTTIVESGLDIPNVNTILIDDADKLGLAQLYQLRGRVGRSRSQGYAYMLYKRAKSLSTVAEQRLDALREFSDLGSGYKIALRDLELRGAGNLLGAEQSGTVAAVGFDLYTQLLEQAISEMKGDEPDPQQTVLPTVEIPVAATIPATYIASEPQRILMYKKLAALRDKVDIAHLQEEFEDRFGDPPPPVWNALALIRLRLRCAEVGIENIATEQNRVIFTLKPGLELPAHTIKPLTHAHRAQAHTFEPRRVVMNLVSSKTLTQTEEMVEVIAKALVEPAPAKSATPSKDTAANNRPRPGSYRDSATRESSYRDSYRGVSSRDKR